MHGRLELGQLSPPASRSNPPNSLTHDTEVFLEARVVLPPARVLARTEDAAYGPPSCSTGSGITTAGGGVTSGR
jgi:hypothetical protein